MEQLDGGRDAVSAAGIRALFRFARPAQRLPASAMANRGGWLTQLPAGAVRQVHRRLEIVDDSRVLAATARRRRDAYGKRQRTDRQRVVSGQTVSVRVDHGGIRLIKKKKNKHILI